MRYFRLGGGGVAVASASVFLLACAGDVGAPAPPPASTHNQTPSGNWQDPGSNFQPPSSNWQPPTGHQAPVIGGFSCPVCGTYSCVTTSPGQPNQTLIISFTPSQDPMSKACFAGSVTIDCNGVLVDDSGGTTKGSWQRVSGTEFTGQVGTTTFDCTLSVQGG